MAYSESLAALKAGVSPLIASKVVLSVPCGLNMELLFDEDVSMSISIAEC